MGEYIEDELDARGWSQSEFASVLGCPAQFVSEVICDQKELTRASAAQIGTAFGTSAEMWLNPQDRHVIWAQTQGRERQQGLTGPR